ncbi:PocR ligand-binding domain-containing protein [Desulfococcaceae bacterium HSG8]|nr:PocR ligand-binding domain-containing protein [Desulfococcaceae bacterium HSG8]
MNYKFSELINVERLRTLVGSFHEVTGVPTSVIELNGSVLTDSGWQDICKKFHRVSPQARQKCFESDTTVANYLLKNKNYAIYECLNGLVDAAVPIKINGYHMANFFTGQFLFNPPNLDFFREQAYKYSFDETDYLGALSRVPIIPRESIESTMSFLSRLAEFIGEMGYNQMEQLKAVKKADTMKKKSEDKLLEILSALSKSMVGIFDRWGNCEFIWGDYSLDKLYGTRATEISLLKIRENLHHIQQVFERGESVHGEYRINVPKGEFCHEVIFFPRFGTPGEVYSVVAVVRDITEGRR